MKVLLTAFVEPLGCVGHYDTKRGMYFIMEKKCDAFIQAFEKRGWKVNMWPETEKIEDTLGRFVAHSVTPPIVSVDGTNEIPQDRVEILFNNINRAVSRGLVGHWAAWDALAETLRAIQTPLSVATFRRLFSAFRDALMKWAYMTVITNPQFDKETKLFVNVYVDLLYHDAQHLPEDFRNMLASIIELLEIKQKDLKHVGFKIDRRRGVVRWASLAEVGRYCQDLPETPLEVVARTVYAFLEGFDIPQEYIEHIEQDELARILLTAFSFTRQDDDRRALMHISDVLMGVK